MSITQVKPQLRRTGLRRAHVAAVRMRCERELLALRGRRGREGSSRILCYHSVGTPRWGVNDVSPAQFRGQLETALQAGYRFVPAQELARAGDTPFQLAVTFDDGLRSVATNAAPLLAELGIPWTLFVVTGWADGRHPFGEDVLLGWRDIERLAQQGATIASHSVTHPNFARLDGEGAMQELVESRQTLAARIGICTTEFAIPMGQSHDWTDVAHTAALAAGYQTVYAQSVQRRHPRTVARTFVTRFDGPRLFRAALRGSYDGWEEWV